MSPAPVALELGQIAVVVSDVARAKRFYVEQLGLAPLFDASPHLSFVRVGSVRLMLTVAEGAGEVGRNSILYFKTAGLDDAYRRLGEQGVTVDSPPQKIAKLADHELWIGFVRDPDGNLVGLMEERR